MRNRKRKTVYLLDIYTSGDVLTRGYYTDTIPTLEAAWYVSFEVKPIATSTEWCNIVHFTINKNSGSYGDRVPAVWFIKHTSRLHICSAVSGNVNHCFNTDNLPFNIFTKIEISNRFQNNGHTWYEIRVGEVLVYSVQNIKPVYFANVKVYKGDPWDNPCSAQIKNLVYDNLPNGNVSFITLFCFYIVFLFVSLLTNLSI